MNLGQICQFEIILFGRELCADLIKYWSLFQTMENQDSSVKYVSLRQAESYVSLDLKPATKKSSNCFNRCLEQWRELDQKYKILTIVLFLILLIASITVGVVSSRGSLIYPGM